MTKARSRNFIAHLTASGAFVLILPFCNIQAFAVETYLQTVKSPSRFLESQKSSAEQIEDLKRSPTVLTIAQNAPKAGGGQGTGVGASAWSIHKGPDEIIDGGSGVGAAVALPPIIDPGSGIGAAVPLPPIIDPGGGVGASVGFILKRPDEIIDGGPGVGAAALLPTLQVLGAGAQLGDPTLASRSPIWVIQQPRLVARPSLPSELVSTVGIFGFKDLDSGLRDCDIPFEELPTRSPFCAKERYKSGERCERFSYNQFPEVVKLYIRASDNTGQLCSGTLIAPDWVLSAGHCFLGDTPGASAIGKHSQRDYVWTATGQDDSFFASVTVEAGNAKLLSPSERLRLGSRVIVSGSYGGRQSDPLYSNDFSLIKLDTPFPSSAVEPATLGDEKIFNEYVTLAGYGYSNANGGTLGKFQVTWPVPIKRASGELNFSPKDGGAIKSGFCQGDSGGPVFAGRVRGCKPWDLAAESRPRTVQGLISFNVLEPPTDFGTAAQEASSSCRNADSMVMQDVSRAEVKKWICRTTAGRALGCR